MTTHTLLAALIVDGQTAPPGASVSLTDAQAEWLDSIGVINRSGAPVPAPRAALARAPSARRPAPKRCGGCGW